MKVFGSSSFFVGNKPHGGDILVATGFNLWRLYNHIIWIL